MTKIELIHGDCLDKLKELPDNSVDSIVTDPPYGLLFMGKKWDYDVPSEEIWRECLRVLKPGGHLLAFAGTRTQHRMAVRIEDAGFEIRDMIAWVYGSGFPKSLNIGKAVDKLQGNEREVVGRSNTVAQKSSAIFQSFNGADGANLEDIDGNLPLTKGTSPYEGWGTALKPSHEDITVAQKPVDNDWLFDDTVRAILTSICQLPSVAPNAKKLFQLNPHEQNAVVSIVQWLAASNTNTQAALYALMDTLQSDEKTDNTTLSTVLSWLNTLAVLSQQWNTYTTETKTSLITDLKTLNYLLVQTTPDDTIKAETPQNGNGANASLVDNLFNALELKLQITRALSATESAIEKVGEKGIRPNLEPITVARKPLIGTVAENVLTHGTGGINIDGCRVGFDSENENFGKEVTDYGEKAGGQWQQGKQIRSVPPTLGRFPANLIHDGSEEVVGLFPSNVKGEIGRVGRKSAGEYDASNYKVGVVTETGFKDSGSAARFFYCAKASKKDRDEGCEHLQARTAGEVTGGRAEGSAGLDSPRAGAGRTSGSKNFHPTVKPTDLMRYLCRLVTPPGGTVLDPFMGSGSTGKAARLEGFDFIGIEREHEYVQIAEARINAVDNKLF